MGLGIADAPPLLIDRDRELGALASVLEAAERGEGSVAVIAGAAGVGKSALVSAAVDQAHELEFDVYRARASELEQELPFGVIRQLFELCVRSAPPAERERLLSGAASATARLFADTPLDHSHPADGGFATLHGLYWLTYGLASERPVMLAVDDAHWADPSSLHALSYLASRISELPVALVIAMRANEPGTRRPAILTDPRRESSGATGSSLRSWGRRR